MPERISKKQLEQRVDYLNSHTVFGTSRRFDNGDRFELEVSAGAYRLIMRHASTAATDISPRGTAREVYDYISGMLAAFDIALGY